MEKITQSSPISVSKCYCDYQSMMGFCSYYNTGKTFQCLFTIVSYTDSPSAVSYTMS